MTTAVVIQSFKKGNPDSDILYMFLVDTDDTAWVLTHIYSWNEF